MFKLTMLAGRQGLGTPSNLGPRHIEQGGEVFSPAPLAFPVTADVTHD